MTNLDSIPESQLTALMDLILEKATEVQKERERSTEKEEALQNDGSPKPSPF